MHDKQLQDHLYSLEERLLHPDREADRQNLIPLLMDDYREFCTSGRIFNRQQTIEDLLASSPRTATIHYFNVELLAEGVALATYRISRGMSFTNHSSLWLFRDNRWQLHFHQGTVGS